MNKYIIAVFLIITLPSLACEPLPIEHKSATIAERTLAATFILEGTIEQPASKSTAASPEDPFIFTVDRWFKGNGPSKVIVRGFGMGPDCLASIPLPSKKVILFAKGNLISDGELELNYIDAFDAVVNSDKAIIDDIINAVGTSPIQPGIVSKAKTPNFSTQTNILQIPELTTDGNKQFYDVEIEFNFETGRFNLKNINSQPIINAYLGVDLRLKMAQSAVLDDENLHITFARVTEDSRCPSDVQCVWAGQVTVLLQFALGERKNLEEHSLTLSTEPAVKKIDKYLVELLEVNPYPVSTTTVVSDYEIVLKVSLI
ncbi:hypothetical protein QUF74_11810 [Candidatus Halobeggiatoa sp. HSG11]|nr:hypothetical protein [Candidatus Halobeggiatoa sp. HSG11]